MNEISRNHDVSHIDDSSEVSFVIRGIMEVVDDTESVLFNWKIFATPNLRPVCEADR
jgi:hypothetical protein